MGQAAHARLAIVVEDDSNVRDLAAAVLEETEFDVVACDSAEEALDVLEDHGVDVGMVFCDVRLPGDVDGVELSRRIAARWPHVRVLVTSGAAGDRVPSLPARARYMQKPWRALDVLMEAERAADSGRA